MRNQPTLWLTSLLFAACTATPAPTASTDEQALDAPNGISLNGISLNGISLNGISLNGISLNGISLNGISLNGISLNGISLNGTSLNGISLNGISLNGTDFIGAHLSAHLSNGDHLHLRLGDIAPLTGANADVLAYEVFARGDDAWVPLCGYDTDGTVKRALIMAGAWDPITGAWTDGGVVSFACRKASIAKCVEFGYKPWLGLADHHLACVRMLRADYCGDGTPHTITGTPINLYDNAGIQLDTADWPVDAEWTPDGAMCVNHTRGGAPPPCYAAKYRATCGSFDGGALLIDEYAGP
jgi:hypothetical protein